ncbi:MAG: hypothetical protein WCG75_01510 [Armatimonadota bacterium]
MAYRSWLKDVKRLDDLATFIHFFYGNNVDEDREWELEQKMYDHFKNSPIPVDPGTEKYFRGSLHDGHVFGIERNKDSVTFTISNTEVEMVSSLIDGELDIERDLDYSPVRLVFEGVNYANAVRPDPEGWLKWDDWENWDPEVDRFSRCWFHKQEGKVQWIGQFRKHVKKRLRQSGDLFVLIDCDRVIAKPESERALRKKLGDECYDAMMFIESLPDEERWLTIGHLRRYLDEKGIPRRVIPHQSEREK